MTGHDIIVIGTSAGGLKALSAVLSEIPPGIGAAIFVVQHLAADKKSYLPKLLGDITDLPVSITFCSTTAAFASGAVLRRIGSGLPSMLSFAPPRARTVPASSEWC